MISVRMSCHYDFKAGDLFCQLQGDLVCHLRCDRIVRVEGLHHMVVHSSTSIVMEPFCVHEFQQGSLGNTVDAGDQLPALVFYLFFLAAVVDDTIETTNSLCPLAFHKMYDCH